MGPQRVELGLSNKDIPKLTQDTYLHWKNKIKMILEVGELWHVISEEEPHEWTAQWEKQNRQVKAIICLKVNADDFLEVCEMETAKEIWENLKKIYEANSVSRKSTLFTQFFNFKMEDNIKYRRRQGIELMNIHAKMKHCI